MKAYDLLKRWQALGPAERDYAIQFFTGALHAFSEGFTFPQKEQPHADWAIGQFEDAIKRSSEKFRAEGLTNIINAWPAQMPPGVLGIMLSKSPFDPDFDAKKHLVVVREEKEKT